MKEKVDAFKPSVAMDIIARSVMIPMKTGRGGTMMKVRNMKRGHRRLLERNRNFLCKR